jgi:hypothetical protein
VGSRNFLQINDLEEAKMRQGGEDIDFGGVLAEDLDGANAVSVEDVMDVIGEIATDCGRWKGDARGPLGDQIFDIQEAVIARGFEILNELSGGEVTEGFRADRPDGCDPGETGAGAPFVSEVEPLTGADGFFDGFPGFEGEESRIADENGGVGLLQHGDGVGRGWQERGMSVEKFAEENFGIGERAARGGVGGDGFYCGERVRGFDDELDGADFIERRYGAAGDDGEIRGERGDGNEAEIGASAEEFVGTERGLRVVEGVAFGESGGEWRVLEVPHERSGVEEVNGCDTEHIR